LDGKEIAQVLWMRAMYLVYSNGRKTIFLQVKTDASNNLASF